MSSWFVKKRLQKTAVEEKTVRVPEGLWIKCEACKELIYRKELVNTHNVCPKCGYHFRIGVEERLENLMDAGWTELLHLVLQWQRDGGLCLVNRRQSRLGHRAGAQRGLHGDQRPAAMHHGRLAESVHGSTR